MEEFDELMVFLARAYGYKEPDWFQQHYGHIYQKNPASIKNSLIIKDSGRIVSHAGLFPLEVMVGKGSLKVGGIGGVATDPDCRGQGLMARLLKFAIEKMEKEAYAFSVLWGDRQRYGNFGWEGGGRRLLVSVNERSLTAGGVKEGDAVKYDGKEKDIEKIRTFHEREKFKVKRSEKTYHLLMEKSGVEVWLGKDSYMVLRGEGKFQDAVESGGDVFGFLSLALSIIKKKGLEGIRISRPYEENRMNREILRASVRWWQETLCSIRIINFSRTLEGFRKAMEGKAKDKVRWPKDEKELVQKMSLSDDNGVDFYIWSLDHV